MNHVEDYLKSVIFEFNRYKTIGDKTFRQLNSNDFFWQYHHTTNSIAIIVKHLNGNMLSRWTNFLLEDGEKTWRNREQEFQNSYANKEEIIVAWEKGWNYLFTALKAIDDSNFDTLIKIRNENHSVYEAINRQLAHYANHVGQIVFIGTMIKGSDWISVSIPKGKSAEFNSEKFGKSSDSREY